jgi:hypothetical protein
MVADSPQKRTLDPEEVVEHGAEFHKTLWRITLPYSETLWKKAGLLETRPGWKEDPSGLHWPRRFSPFRNVAGSGPAC